MNQLKNDEIRQVVLENYTSVAESDGKGCGCASTSSCGTASDVSAVDVAVTLGYSREQVSAVPEGANMGLGCGNPQAIASLAAGETVLDLGSGGGFDCFLAARAVGELGHVIGVDMTSEMIGKARRNAEKAGLGNVEFRLGEIESLPVADALVDVIISNCVINLSPEKDRVFSEAFRVLRPGGRLAISDIVATAELPEELKKDMTLYTGCMAGASSINVLESVLHGVGFEGIQIRPKDESNAFIRDWAPGHSIEDYVVSATIEAVKPESL
jgi:SAM-dependent methyltransferase